MWSLPPADAARSCSAADWLLPTQIDTQNAPMRQQPSTASHSEQQVKKARIHGSAETPAADIHSADTLISTPEVNNGQNPAHPRCASPASPDECVLMQTGVTNLDSEEEPDPNLLVSDVLRRSNAGDTAINPEFSIARLKDRVRILELTLDRVADIARARSLPHREILLRQDCRDGFAFSEALIRSLCGNNDGE
jgi:hypothetical protein